MRWQKHSRYMTNTLKNKKEQNRTSLFAAYCKRSAAIKEQKEGKNRGRNTEKQTNSV